MPLVIIFLSRQDLVQLARSHLQKSCMGHFSRYIWCFNVAISNSLRENNLIIASNWSLCPGGVGGKLESSTSKQSVVFSPTILHITLKINPCSCLDARACVLIYPWVLFILKQLNVAGGGRWAAGCGRSATMIVPPWASWLSEVTLTTPAAWWLRCLINRGRLQIAG